MKSVISKITLSIALLLSFNLAFAFSFDELFDELVGREKMSGAFGIELGEKFDASLAIRRIGDLNSYFIKPPKKFRSFTKYRVDVSPITNLVVSIYATGDMATHSLCTEEFFFLDSILEKKYGSIDSFDVNDFSYDYESRYEQGNRSISLLGCGEIEELHIHYRDSDLYKQQSNEELELKIQKVNSSAL